MCPIEAQNNSPKQTFPLAVRRAAVYSFLLHECLCLTDAHATAVERYWGLSDSYMVNKGYAVTPSPVAKIVIEHEISMKFGPNVEGVAGFYCDDQDVWRLNVGANVLLIPVRESRGFIVGVQVCLAIETGKLYWFTSKDKPRGASALAQPHIANPKRARESRVVMLTNNTLLADARASGFNVGVIGFNNCKTDILLNSLNELSITHVFNALWPFDRETDQSYAYVLKAIERAGIKLRAEL